MVMGNSENLSVFNFTILAHDYGNGNQHSTVGLFSSERLFLDFSYYLQTYLRHFYWETV